MFRKRPPWWLLFGVAVWSGYFGLMSYSAFTGPAEPGMEAEFRDGHMIVRATLANSPAVRAGLLPADRIVGVGGQQISTRLDWMAAAANLEPGRPVALKINRDGHRFETSLTLAQRSWNQTMARGAVVGFALWGLRLIVLVLGILLGFARHRDLLARVGAAFMGTAAVSFVVVLNGMAPTWRQWPRLAGELMLAPALSTLALPAIFFTFCALFPHSAFRSGRAWAAAWLPAMIPLPWFAGYLYRMIYEPETARFQLPPWILPIFVATSLAYIAGGVVVLAVSHQRLEAANDRRRVRLLAAGSVIGWLAALPLIVLDWRGSASSVAPGFFSSPLAILAAALFFTFLLLLAYTILRRRIFDMRIMIRQGLQYALARRLLVSVTPVLAALLVLDLWIHGDQPLAAIVRARGWIYVAVAGLGSLAHRRRQSWLDALDRRFFRERYDARHLLSEVADEIHRAGSFDRVAPRVVAQIEAALHPEFVALLVRRPPEETYRTLAAAPAGHAPPPLARGSKIIALVRVLGKPLDISLSQSGWLAEQLPHDDTGFLRDSHIDLLVPIATDPGRDEALLALGAKRSEEPYTDEDRDLLVAIGTSLALLLERPSATPTPALAMLAECPECGVCYDSGVSCCSREGAALVAAPIPRVLVSRYRLERRIGRGGMGTVYEAVDTALERRVAAKMVREDLVGNADLAERFRREALAAAAVTHPNIVTIYDFGVVLGTRAFLVMELLGGLTLRETLHREKRIPPLRALDILRGVCAAVDAAHRLQLIHRDLKPENIFLVRAEPAEIPKVMDFGLAKFLHPVAVSQSAPTRLTAGTTPGIFVGTLKYMSPEQLRGEQACPAWDLWALAVTAYEMLTGAYPFADASGADWYRAVYTGGFTPIQAHIADAPPGWQILFERALSSNPDQRPKSGREFATGLERTM